MLKTLLIIVVLAVLGVLGFAATRPDSFVLQRSTTIAAPPERVFGLINDLHGFNTWNPWALKDPTTKLSYEGPDSGPGAAYRWTGEKLGSGRMQIIESVPGRLVAARLEFRAPMEATNRVDFTLQPEGSGTRITWAMSGAMPFVSKLMSVFVSMDKMVGPDFEAGLANLKAAAEKS